jgi:hypothetical protein
MLSSMLMTGSSMHCTTEFSIELSDQDLADLPEINISDAEKSVAPAAHKKADYDLVEIELTPEEMDDMLSNL